MSLKFMGATVRKGLDALREWSGLLVRHGGMRKKSLSGGSAMTACAPAQELTCTSKHLSPSPHFVVDSVQANRALYGPAHATTGVTVRSWGATWLERRELEGVRSVADDRSRWRTHVETSAWIDLPLERVTRAMARAWWSSVLAKPSSNPTHKGPRRQQALAAKTLSNIRQVPRKCFEDARAEGLIETNPFDALEVPRGRRAKTRSICVLYPHEQELGLSLFAGKPERWLVEFALFSGLRQREQWALRLADVDLSSEPPSVLARFGSVQSIRPTGNVVFEKIDGAYFLPTKNGSPRRVYLNARAAAAMRAWLKHLEVESWLNPHGLAFPARDGRPRRKGRVFRGFSRLQNSIGRPFSWHGLRHSCASSLVGGWWGETWLVSAVQEHLGHSSIEVTQRYVHIAATALQAHAVRTSGPPQAAREHGATMVDGKNGAAETASHVPVAQRIEQRFPNTQPTPEQADRLLSTELRSRAEQIAAECGKRPPGPVDVEKARAAAKRLINVDDDVLLLDAIDELAGLRSRCAALEGAVQRERGNYARELGLLRGELALAEAARDDAKCAREEARIALHCALNAPGEARRILGAGELEPVDVAAARVVKERNDEREAAARRIVELVRERDDARAATDVVRRTAQRVSCVLNGASASNAEMRDAAKRTAARLASLGVQAAAPDVPPSAVDLFEVEDAGGPMFREGAIVRVRSTGQGGRVRVVNVGDRRHYAAGSGAYVFTIDSLIDGHSIGTFVGAELEEAPELVELSPEAVARLFHEAYERLAPLYGYQTRRESAVPWEGVPVQNRALMVATAAAVLADLRSGSPEHAGTVGQSKDEPTGVLKRPPEIGEVPPMGARASVAPRASQGGAAFHDLARRFIRENGSAGWEEATDRLAILLGSVASEARLDGRVTVDADMAYRLRTAVGLLHDVDTLRGRIAEFLDAEVSR